MNTTTPFSKAMRGLIAGITIATIGAACGGGGNGLLDTTSGIDAGGRPFLTAGTITGFGSVFVNGVQYSTLQASITTDGMAASDADLRVGQFVVISGTISNGVKVADAIDYDDDVEGPVQSIDLAASSFVILGQTVLVDGNTVFDDSISPATLDGISVADVLEVSGHRNSNGAILATYIEDKPAGGEFEVTGIAASVDTAAMTFMIDQLLIDYSGAVLQDFPGGMPANGDLVEVKGTQIGAAGELIATSVEFKDGDVDEDTDVEIEGLITRFVSDTDFDVAGLPVTTTATTVYEGGTAADLALNVKVEAEGVINAAGILVADTIEFKRGTDIRIEAIVDSVDAAAQQLVMLGITVEFTATTSIEDDSSADLRPFAITDINAGDWLEVRGAESATTDNVLVAVRVERDDPEAEARIRGIAENVADPSFEILGLPIDTVVGTDFEDEFGIVITSVEFFAQAPDRLVEAHGNLNGMRFAATEAELED